MYQNDFPIRFSTGNRELSIPKDFDIGLFINVVTIILSIIGIILNCSFIIY